MITDSAYKKNDPVYLSTQEYSTPKEYFKQVTSRIKTLVGDKPISLIDFACAAGGFLHYTSQHLTLQRKVGVDISEKLLAQAKTAMPDGDWIVCSLTEAPRSLASQFDVATCLGTLSLLDDLDKALPSLFSVIKPGGHLVLFDVVNDDPIDTLMRYRRATADEEWQPAFNVRSLATYEKALQRAGGKGLRFADFRIGIDLPRGEDPMRAWTIATSANPHQLVVGTGQMLNFKILEVQKA